MYTQEEVTKIIANSKQFWYNRNLKFQEWYELLTLVDALYTRGMETYVSNEPMTLYNMAHYLLTKGELSHTTPIENDLPWSLTEELESIVVVNTYGL